MELYWQGRNITRSVKIMGCIHRDMGHGRSDGLELTLDRAGDWYRWGPEQDDTVRVVMDGYDTGEMYLNTVIPEGRLYRVIATGLKRAAGVKSWGSYENVTLENLFDRVAAEARMAGRLYGVDGGIRYRYLLRKDEGCAAFLARIGELEGLRVKAEGGAIRGIALSAAQSRQAAARIAISAKQEGVYYRRQDNRKWTSLTVRTPYGSATARDTAAEGNNPRTMTGLPVENNAQAGRWARNLLTAHNRKAEDIGLEPALDTRLKALERVDISGGTDMDGRWVVEEAEHDLFNRRTAVRLARVTETVV